MEKRLSREFDELAGTYGRLWTVRVQDKFILDSINGEEKKNTRNWVWIRKTYK